MNQQRYLVQCLNGHINEVVQGTELESMCKARESKGLLDALYLPDDDCPDCIEEKRRWLGRNLEDSRFHDMIRGLPLEAY